MREHTRVSGSERAGERRRGLRFGRVHFVSGSALAHRGGDAREQSAAADGAITASTSGRSSTISSADRPVAADERVVIERVDEMPRIRSERCRSTVRQHSSYDALTIVAPSRSIGRSLVSGAVSITITLHAAPAVGPRGRPPERHCRRSRSTRPGRADRAESAHRVVGAADLERADRLQRLELQEDLRGPP